MEAFVTMATNDEYVIGALVLGHSLRDVQTTRKLVILTTSSVSSAMSQQLNSVFDLVEVVDLLDSHDAAHLQLMSRPELGVTLTKVHCWRLTQFRKCVFLDADTLVLQNIDELFDREELSAAPDASWPDCFNSGVFVFRPSDETYNALLHFMSMHGSFDGGDQGLLNSFFSDWATKDITRHLSFTYNVVTQAFYSFLPALKRFGKDVKVVHFIGSQKPWHISCSPAEEASGSTDHTEQFIRIWWKTFNEKLQPVLEVTKLEHRDSILDPVVKPIDIKHEVSVMNSDAAIETPDKVPLPEVSIAEPDMLASPGRQEEWENGQIDYMGRDRFENIQKQLDAKMTLHPLKTKELNSLK